MKHLNELLTTDDLTLKKTKAPLLQEVIVPDARDIPCFMVLKKERGFYFVPNRGRGLVRSFFRDSAPEDPSLFVETCAALFQHSMRQYWGCSAYITELNSDLARQIQDRASSVSNDIRKAWCSLDYWGEDQVRSFLATFANGDQEVLLYNVPELDHLFVMATDSDKVGTLTRVFDKASVVIHNPEYGLILLCHQP